MSWQLQDAKNRLSEVIREAQAHGPQTITVRGKEAVVVVAAEDYHRLVRPKRSLWEFLRASPLVGVELDLTRPDDTGRAVEV
jgi:prevent-host-death family protein